MLFRLCVFMSRNNKYNFCTVGECKKRWKILRTAMTEELEKQTERDLKLHQIKKPKRPGHYMRDCHSFTQQIINEGRFIYTSFLLLPIKKRIIV